MRFITLSLLIFSLNVARAEVQIAAAGSEQTAEPQMPIEPAMESSTAPTPTQQEPMTPVAQQDANEEIVVPPPYEK